MRPLVFGKAACQDLEWALKKEWLETNGLGGYGSSTIIGANTRRYHGVLVAALRDNDSLASRWVLVSGFQETLYIGTQKFDLSTEMYGEWVPLQGYAFLSKFSLDPFPTFTYEIDEISVEKKVWLIHGQNTAVITYQLLSGDQDRIRLELRPKVAYRPFHSLARKSDGMGQEPVIQKGKVSLAAYPKLPPLLFYHNAGITDKSSKWYPDVEYPEEKERGLDHLEDLFSPCSLIFSFASGEPAYCIATTQERQHIDIEELKFAEEKRRASLEAPQEVEKEAVKTLWRTSGHFLIRSGAGRDRMIAGYHWFEDWGRDTFISLPGLALVTRRYAAAKDFLLSYLPHISRGMIPNRFPERAKEPDYHSVDASLWYINAVYEYFLETEDHETVMKELYPAVTKILKHYKQGTRFDIHMDSDALLWAGSPQTHLTWMDACIGTGAVTGRYGKAVEVNALWYNALKIMEVLSSLFQDEKVGGAFRDLAFQTKESFNRLFWNKKTETLYDVLRPGVKDDSLRPNQLFAISLPFPVLDESRWKSVLKKVEAELLTPLGVRSLSPRAKTYQGFYTGDPRQRDRAYHQGSVWPWLIGPYITAFLKCHGRGKTVKAKLMEILDSLFMHLEDTGLGFIPEIFDGDSPHTPRGAVAQAWNSAEILRAYFELVGDDQKARPAREFVLR
ncbi:MAG: glycogen debranching enzyme N-terminal domain-containing protein [Elusimicrobia bacterium]|nr:glycogen debranching enzyme N-terminal domain-containing protein [Elusimicrobiota bacterium]